MIQLAAAASPRPVLAAPATGLEILRRQPDDVDRHVCGARDSVLGAEHERDARAEHQRCCKELDGRERLLLGRRQRLRVCDLEETSGPRRRPPRRSDSTPPRRSDSLARRIDAARAIGAVRRLSRGGARAACGLGEPLWLTLSSVDLGEEVYSGSAAFLPLFHGAARKGALRFTGCGGRAGIFYDLS